MPVQEFEFENLNLLDFHVWFFLPKWQRFFTHVMLRFKQFWILLQDYAQSWSQIACRACKYVNQTSKLQHVKLLSWGNYIEWEVARAHYNQGRCFQCGLLELNKYHNVQISKAFYWQHVFTQSCGPSEEHVNCYQEL
jgi:hypothetical protein